MQKNINIYLLILVLFVAGALAGSAVYYQENFDDLTKLQEETLTNLSQCKSSLVNVEFNLNKTIRSLNTTSQDIRRYDELYTTKDEELKTTAQNLESTETQLQTTKLTLQEETALKNKFKQQYQDEVQVSKGFEEQNAILTSQKAQLEDDVIKYRRRIESSESCIARFVTDYTAVLTEAMKTEVSNCEP